MTGQASSTSLSPGSHKAQALHHDRSDHDEGHHKHEIAILERLAGRQRRRAGERSEAL
jgi:hypothetical protein